MTFNNQHHLLHWIPTEEDDDVIEETKVRKISWQLNIWKYLYSWMVIVVVCFVWFAMYKWLTNKSTAIAEDTSINEMSLEYNWTRINQLQDEIIEELLIQKENNKIIKEKQQIVSESIWKVKEKEEEQKQLRLENLNYVNSN